MSLIDKYEIDWVREEDVDEIVALFSCTTSRTMTPDYYRWQFFHEEQGGYNSVVLRTDGAIISHAGYSLREWRINGSLGRIMAKHTSITHPDFQGRGLYTKLMSWAHQHFSDMEIMFVLSWPNLNNHPSQRNRTDYIDVYQIPALKWVPKVKSPKNCDQPPLKKTSEINFDDWAEIADITPGKALYTNMRTPKYLRWRFKDHPETAYYIIENRVGGKLGSALIFKLYPPKKPDRINVVEWLCDPEDRRGSDAFGELENYAALQGLPIMIWHNVHDYPRHHMLERRGFVLSEPIFYFGVFALDNPKRLGEYLDWSKWYKSMGDVDVF